MRYYSKDCYKNHVVIRPEAIANFSEIVRRLGVIAMNTPVEVDMYAHANSSLIGGTKMINGLGNFLRNAYLSIMHTPLARQMHVNLEGNEMMKLKSRIVITAMNGCVCCRGNGYLQSGNDSTE